MTTIKGYKLFRTLKSKPGKLFPLFIGKNVETPIGEWIPAAFIPTEGFAHRPGWHAGTIPVAKHLMRKDGSMQKGRVWAEVELPASVNWQEMADAQPTKDIRGEVPVDGYYRFPRPANQGGEWIIAGALRINRILSDADVRAILGEGN